MTMLQPISGARFRERLAARKLGSIDDTHKPRQAWISISQLRIDPRFQRELRGRASEANVIAIAEKFDWMEFGTVIVSEIEGAPGTFSIVDGQHRVTAAALRGIRDVPCAIYRADIRRQARAFAAINGRVTPVSTMQLYHARVAAGDAAALELQAVCGEAGVTICRYPVPANEMKAGETLAAAKLSRQLARYGRETLFAALCCLTRTGDNVGMVRAPVVEALCAVLDSEPAWRGDLDQLVDAMRDFDFFRAWSEGRVTASRDRVGLSVPLVDLISAHLEQRLAA